MSDVALLVVDECHHTVGNHSYARIMEQHYHRVAREQYEIATLSLLRPKKVDFLFRRFLACQQV